MAHLVFYMACLSMVSGLLEGQKKRSVFLQTETATAKRQKSHKLQNANTAFNIVLVKEFAYCRNFKFLGNGFLQVQMCSDQAENDNECGSDHIFGVSSNGVCICCTDPVNLSEAIPYSGWNLYWKKMVRRIAKAAGMNRYGQLGVPDNYGTGLPNPIPKEVSTCAQNLCTDVAAISAGRHHTMFLMNDGSVKAAGSNVYGQLGIPVNSEASNPTPTWVVALGTGVAAISAGFSHTTFLMKDGSVKAVGRNKYGALGVLNNFGTDNSNPAPISVTDLGTNVVAISAGRYHTVFLMMDGSVKTVGYNNRGQLGAPVQEYSPTPVNVVALGTRVAAISAGDSHTMFLMSDGSVKAAGWNHYGQLGVPNNFRTSNPDPINVVALDTDVAAISAGLWHTAFLMKNGSVKAVGHNGRGQLGAPGSGRGRLDNPQTVDTLGTDVAAISSGEVHTVFLMKDGSVKATGFNTYGQLGQLINNSYDSSSIPVGVTDLGVDVVAVSAGSDHTVFVVNDG